jgi:multidrug efflux pump subunit AcrB
MNSACQQAVIREESAEARLDWLGSAAQSRTGRTGMSVSQLIENSRESHFVNRSAVAAQIKKVFQQTPGVVDVDWFVEDPQTKFDMKVDLEKAALHGISPADVSRTLQVGLGGANAGLLHDPHSREDIPISNAVVDGHYVLRACIVNFHTSQLDVEAVPDIVARIGREADTSRSRRLNGSSSQTSSPNRQE